MADLSEKNSAQTVKVVGADSTGAETNYQIINKYGFNMVGFGKPHIDAEHKFRVTQPYALFEGSFKFSKESNYWSESTGTGGTATYDSTLRAIKLSTTTSSGSFAYYQTYRHYHYTEGRSQLCNIFCLWGAPIANNRKRVGIFNARNGIYFESDGTTLYAVSRSDASGSVVNTRVAQSSWSIDKLDGTGASGFTADPTKMQVFYLEYSSSIMRFGVKVENEIVYVHEMYCSNTSATPCMNSKDLPMRFEIENTAGAASASSIYIMNTSVSSEGAQRGDGTVLCVDSGTTSISVSTTNKVVAGIRMGSAACAAGGSIYPIGFQIQPVSGTSVLYYRVILRPTLTGSPTWAALSDVSEGLTNTPTYTEGTGIVIASGYISLGSGSGSGYNATRGQNTALSTDQWLGCAIDGSTADELIMVVKTLSGTGSISFNGTFSEYA